MAVKAQDIIDSCRELAAANVPYVWWQDGDPIPMWYYVYGYVVPHVGWFMSNGIMCSDLINYGRMAQGLGPIGGTPAYYDWLLGSTGEEFDVDASAIPGALIVNPGVWRGGVGQGHIAMYTDEHTLIQSTDGYGDFAGVNEGESDYDTVSWWSPWLYGLMPDVDYSDVMDDAPTPQPALTVPRWISIDRAGWLRADGPDWSGGWYATLDDGSISEFRRSDDA